ncbi:Fumarate hydratase class II [Tritrichomonas foetus]|uniref:fumarate hydratase n=1 Tax=Tritrichomonas foetus TaxID=1144522 RepID=A0A1J4K9J5_9EUKA|nr:Fumarate hydratase class II [Tritrichomonas foetus]|eukprot:OHT08095.1 Fumarate hydratase class II [Tritrichomonas foetus]
MSELDFEACRVERDSFGPINVPGNRHWGAQTQRSLQNFKISTERMPIELIHALARIKRAAAIVNCDLGKIEVAKRDAIVNAADEVILEHYSGEFPLSIWQTGSGTQTNMNMNEVLANIASTYMGGGMGEKRLIHPNDDVNKGQSSNDVFPTAMHIAAAESMQQQLLPAVTKLRDALLQKSEEFKDIIKIGRTHLQDATPLTLGQEFSGYVDELDVSMEIIRDTLPRLYQLAIGGTAVGTGLNAHPEFSDRICAELEREMNIPFKSAPNKFAALAGHEPIVAAHAAIKTLAAALFKIANDIRWLASGPRSGLGEISIPENEPGSSIMPGKVNPTQCEAVTMACARVFGNDTTVGFAGASGNFELNVYKPVIIDAFMQSVRLMTDCSTSFRINCVEGIKANVENISNLMERSLMLATALTPYIGYDKAAKIAMHANKNNLSLRESAIQFGGLTNEQFDEWVVPSKMIGNLK